MTTTAGGWIKRHPIWSAVAMVVGPSVLALLIAPFVEADLRKALYTGVVGLFFAGLIGGLVKILLDSYTLSIQQRASDAGYVYNILADLKGVYDRVERVRILIPAHRSAKTYGDEMRDLIQSRVQLRNVIRALQTRDDTVVESRRSEIVLYVDAMEKYLTELTDEFRTEYKVLSEHQRVYEARVDARLKKSGEDAQVQSVFVGESMWRELIRLPRLADFVGAAGASSYGDRFETPLDMATACLRAELARISRGQPANAQVTRQQESGPEAVAGDQVTEPALPSRAGRLGGGHRT